MKTQEAITKQIDGSSPPIIQPRPCTLRFPPLWSHLRFYPWEKVSDDEVTKEVNKWLQVQKSNW